MHALNLTFNGPTGKKHLKADDHLLIPFRCPYGTVFDHSVEVGRFAPPDVIVSLFVVAF